MALGLLAGVLLLAGLAAGIIAGLLGVGGGIVIVPVLFHALGAVGVPETHIMHVAVGTSLASIVATGYSSIRAHYARGAVDVGLLRAWAPAVAAGVLAGTAVAASVKGAVLTGIFATVALAVASYMSLGREDWRLADQPPGGWLKNLIAATIGSISSMMGIGGGSLSVPTLVLCNYPIRRAVGTSAALGLVIAVPGALGYVVAGWGVPERPDLSLGYVNLLGLALVTPASILAAPLGARLAHAIPPAMLRRAFAVFLALTSLKMYYAILF